MPITLTLGSYLHDLSPFIVEFGTGMGLRWYGTAYALGFVYAYFLLSWMSRKGWTSLPRQRVPEALAILVLCVIAGGRLGYVLIYDRELLTQFTSGFPFWGALRLSQGGMAYHGAVVGVMLGGWIISRGFRAGASGERVGMMPWRSAMDAIAFASTIGLGLGRIANFINGELLGKVVAMPGQPAPWWAVRFPQELLDGHAPQLSPEQQTQLDVVIDAYRLPGMSDAQALSSAIDILQTGSASASARVAAQLEPLLAARHPSQLYQAFFEGVVLTAVLWIVWRVPRAPGVVGAWFLITYGVMRIIAEFYRLPDAHFAVARPLGLSRGQWLSAAMVLGGALALAWIRTRKNEPKRGGWQTT